MRLRERSLATTLLCLSFISASAIKVNPPAPLLAEDEVFQSAFNDTMNILSGMNECSNFFGGPVTSVDVFKSLVAPARKDLFASSIGIVMSGATTNVVSVKTGRKHRLFDKFLINRNGPFYRHRDSERQINMPGVGRFQPNTREARVLMLLHELGHVVQAEGKWLLADDGQNVELSRSNTRKVEEVCGRQIRNLGKGDDVMIPVSGKSQAAH